MENEFLFVDEGYNFKKYRVVWKSLKTATILNYGKSRRINLAPTAWSGGAYDTFEAAVAARREKYLREIAQAEEKIIRLRDRLDLLDREKFVEVPAEAVPTEEIKI